jgi:hypothetical protein
MLAVSECLARGQNSRVRRVPCHVALPLGRVLDDDGLHAIAAGAAQAWRWTRAVRPLVGALQVGIVDGSTKRSLPLAAATFLRPLVGLKPARSSASKAASPDRLGRPKREANWPLSRRPPICSGYR